MKPARPARRPRGPKADPALDESSQEPSQQDREARAQMLERISEIVCAKRDANIEYRRSSGIEEIWKADEDAYEGIDDANRNEVQKGLLSGGNKPGTGGIEPAKVTGCTLLPNITQPYVDMAAAKVGDMLIPTDDRNFVVEPTAVPDVLDEQEGFPNPQPAAEQAAPAMPQPQGAPAAGLLGAAAGQPMPPAATQPTPQQSPEEFLRNKLTAIASAAAKAGAKRAQELIDDALEECQYQSEVRQAIDDGAKVGTGILKGPFAVKRTSTVRTLGPDGEVVTVIKEETVPASKRIDYWNAFPAAGCGESIQHGDSFFERDFMTRKQLIALTEGVGTAAYFDDQIAAAIEEGPMQRKAENIGRQQQDSLDEKAVFEVWYGYVEMTGADLQALGCNCKDPLKSYPALVTVVNDRVIKAARNPLESGEFPYDFLPWKRRKNMPWGIGIARQAAVAQRTYTAAYRNLMDNAGASARPHKVTTGELMQVEGDPWSWKVDPDDIGTRDVRAAMQFIIQPSLQNELTAIMAQAERMIELSTGLPKTILGLQDNVQETAQGRALLNNNGSSVLRRVARLFDSCLTEPHISRYYEWLREYNAEDDPEIAGGDFRIRARGSSALVERDIQNQQLPAILQMSLNPAYELDPKLTAREMLKAQKFDPKNFELTAQRRQELMAMQPKPQPPYQIVVSQQREQGETQRLQMQQQFDAQEAERERQLKMALKQIDAQLAGAELTAAQRQALDDVKATLAGITIKVNAQRELAGTSGQVLTPPTEPPGRAVPGHAYEQ